MNFEKRMIIVLLALTVILLSSCEVYQTISQPNQKENKIQDAQGKVIRVEGKSAKEASTLEKSLYASASATRHDPFKQGQNALGPFEKGASLGITLGQWLSASGIGVYSVEDGNGVIDLSFKNLVSNGVYTVWCSGIAPPTAPEITYVPCGASDGSENSFKSDSKGTGLFSVKMSPFEPSTNESASIILLVYNSDGATHGDMPGDFGLNSHVQLFYLMPHLTGNSKNYQIPIKFINHIQANLPEQDVFIEYEEQASQNDSSKNQVNVNIDMKPKEEKETTPVIEKPSQKEPATGETVKDNREQPASQQPKEKPVVVTIDETDLLNLIPKAEDPDKNTSLDFTFTSPVSEQGQWKTNYGDAGEYTITVTASDGETTTSRDVLIIVRKKEEPPIIEGAKPVETGLVIDETQSINFSLKASDLNHDNLSFVWKLDGVDVSNDDSYTYQTTYDDEGTHTIKVEVSDGTSSTSKIWSIQVRNVNRKPVLEKISDVTLKEGEKITITALATDEDKDPIKYSISDKRFIAEDNIFMWQTDYDSAGKYKVTISASDGKDTSEQQFTIDVENVNRPPVITDIVQKK